MPTRKMQKNSKGIMLIFGKLHFNSILLIVCFLLLLATKLYTNYQITGDEPHYLLMDYSLTHDKDLNLKNNYQRGDYLSFYPAPMGPERHVGAEQFKTKSPQLYSIHGIGLPLILLPGYILAKQIGATVEMVLLATVVVWLTWLWALQVTKNNKLATLSSAFFFICFFFTGLAGYIYPDLVISSLTLGSLIIIGRYYDKTLYQLLFGVMVSGLVFLHFRTLALAPPLFLIMIHKVWREKHTLPWFAILSVGVGVLLFFLSLHRWFGVWNPREIYSSGLNLNTSPLRTIPAMLFDSNRGLIIYNPILLLLFVGIFPWIKQRGELFLITLLAVLPSMMLVTLFNEWQGGYAPVGRYIMAFLPVFVPAMAFALALMKNVWQKVLIGVLVAITLFITSYSTLTKVGYINTNIFRTRSIFFGRVENRTGIGFDRLLPNYSSKTTLDDRLGRLKILLGALMIVSLVGYGYVMSKRLKPIKE